MDSITKYINFYEIIKKRKAKNPFSIFNTDKHNEPGTHWWSFMDILPKQNLFLFDSFGLEGFKLFTVDNDKSIIDELLFNFRKCKVSLTNQRITLCTMKFSTNTWEKVAHNKREQLIKNVLIIKLKNQVSIYFVLVKFKQLIIVSKFTDNMFIMKTLILFCIMIGKLNRPYLLYSWN